MSDQAASLRQWAAKRNDGTLRAEEVKEPTSTPRTKAMGVGHHVVVFGFPRPDDDYITQAGEVFKRWASQGKKWVGDPARWHISSPPENYTELTHLSSVQSRWALWVGDDIDSFARVYKALKIIHAVHGPRRIIALHPPMPKQGLLTNIQYIARQYFNIDVLVFTG